LLQRIMRAVVAVVAVTLCVVCCGFNNNNNMKSVTRVDYSGSCGENATWQFDENTKTLTISGTGKMKDYSDSSTVPWTHLRSSINTVVMEEGITSIGGLCFFDIWHLETLTIPSTVTSIGSSAFGSCRRLTSMTISANVTKIGSAVFGNCARLTSIVVDKNNKNYKTVDNVLFNSEGTTLLAYPCGKEEKTYTVPDGVTIIDDDAFASCSNLTSVTLPNSVKVIEFAAFFGCKGLSSIRIPPNVTSIGPTAFGSCINLTSVNIPSSVTSMADNAFNDCDNLTSFTVDENNTLLKSVDGVLFDANLSTLQKCPPAKTGSYTIPSGVTAIKKGAFSCCKKLTSVTIPSSVTKIGNYAFEYCENLKSVNIPSSITSIEYETFFGCKSLTSVNIPSSVTSIGRRAFENCKSLKSINVDKNNQNYKSIDGVLFSYNGTILIACPGGKEGNYSVPYNVATISDFAFYGCSLLTSVDISSTVTQIGNYAFSSCYNLTSMTFHELTAPQCGTNSFSSGVNVYGPIDYNSTEFCGKTVNSNVSASTLEDLREHNNHCYEVIVYDENNTSVRKRDNATEWESRTNVCGVFTCDNETGPVKQDFCVSSNPYPKCFVSECKRSGICSNVSTYLGNWSGCVASVKCDVNKGWIETEKNCTAVILASTETSSLINENTASCYDFICGSRGKCSYKAHKECGRVCDEEAENECQRSASAMKNCTQGKCTEILKNGIWQAKCVYDKQDGWQELVENHCYETVCEKDKWVLKERDNATATENECYEFHCDNETGGVTKNKCVSSDTVERVCLNDQCIATEKLNEEFEKLNEDYEWNIEIMFGGVDAASLDTEEVKRSISEAVGVTADLMKVSVQIDGSGKVSRIIVSLNDENAAQIIVDAVNECSTYDTNGNINSKCKGVLLKSRAVHILPKVLSEAANLHSMVIVTMIAMLMMMMLVIV